MRIYTSNDFHGFWPVGTAAVIVAHDEATARLKLIAALGERKIQPPPGKSLDDFTLVPLDPTKPEVRILRDGDY